MIIDYASSLVPIADCKKRFDTLLPEINICKKIIQDLDYSSGYSFLNLPQQNIKPIIETINQKKALKPSLLIVIGIGGSNLGTLAVQEALYGKLYNDSNPEIKIYYADTVDTEYMTALLTIMESYLSQQKVILLNVVTKSGTTTETVANFEVLLEVLIKYYPTNYRDHVVVTTDKDSLLWNKTMEEGYTLLEIPRFVGGRYSVLSVVGLFPLGMIGCDIQQLLAGAQSMLDRCTSATFEENKAATTATIMYEQYKQCITIQDMFLFVLQLEGLGKWYRQLMGESIGKEFDKHDNKVEIGITPTVSIGSIDLHSVGQLYLGGPHDKNSTFVSVEKHKNNLLVPADASFDTLVPGINNKSFAEIMDAILQGVKKAYQKQRRPFISITLSECNEYYIGQFLQYKMIEMVYLGYLLNINPFDQPNVELYKKETRTILNKTIV